jgi:hypothetical protein
MRNDALPAESSPELSLTMRRSSAINLSDSDALLLLQFSAEVKQAAISCASLLSWLNAADLSRQVTLPASITSVMPPRPQRAFLTVGQSSLRPMLTPAVGVGLKGFALFLSSSADAVEALVAMFGPDALVNVADTATAGDRLTGAACFAKMTLKDLIAIHERLFREYDVAELSYLAAMLDDVLQGQSPLFADGNLVAPKTNFAIRDIRVALNADAVVAQSDIVARVVVRNISRGGLGFEAAGNIETGQTVVVRLTTSGRQLTGRVVWKVGQKAGVEFFQRLEDHDDLFT